LNSFSSMPPDLHDVGHALDLRHIFAYAKDVSSVRACRVSFTDAEGITHTAVVPASSLYEAAALALAEFRGCGLVETLPGPVTRLTVAVASPSTIHDVPMSRLSAWLESGGKSPKEQALKVRLRETLDRR